MRSQTSTRTARFNILETLIWTKTAPLVVCTLKASVFAVFLLTIKTTCTNMQVRQQHISEQPPPPDKVRHVDRTEPVDTGRGKETYLLGLDSYRCTRRLSVQQSRRGCALRCGSRYHVLRQKKNGLDRFRVETKHKSKEEQSVNHVPHTKLSRLYSTAKTSDRSSVSACLDTVGCEA